MATIAVTIVKASERELPLVRILNNHDGDPRWQIPRLQKTVKRRKVYQDDRWFKGEKDKKQFYREYFNGIGDFAAEVFLACRTTFNSKKLGALERRFDSYILPPRPPKYAPHQGPKYTYELWPDSEGSIIVRSIYYAGLAGSGRPKILYHGLLSDFHVRDEDRITAEVDRSSSEELYF